MKAKIIISYLHWILPALVITLSLIGLKFNLFDKSIPALETKKIPIAFIEASEGHVKYRFTEDTVWLPAQEKAPLHSGDFIQTGPGSMVSLRMSDTSVQKSNLENYLIIKAKSFVRIYQENGKLKLDLQQGKIETQFASPGTLKIQNGLTESELKIPPNRARVDFKRNQTAFTLSETNKSEPEPIREEPTTPSAEKIAHDEQFKNLESYPKDGTFLLYKNLNDIKMRPHSYCLDSCQLVVFFKGKVILNKSYSQGPIEDILISKNELMNYKEGEFKWKFFDQKAMPPTFEGRFFLYPYSEDNFAKALENASPIEFLDE